VRPTSEPSTWQKGFAELTRTQLGLLPNHNGAAVRERGPA
jgi:hypothetical protein